MLKPSRTDAGLKQEVRSSIATFFTPEDEMAVPAIAKLKQRAFDVTKLPFENQEELQMQRYREPRDASGQKDFYVPHFDSQPEHDRKRVATIILYLEEPEEGGETIFPMVHVNSTIRNKHLFSHTVTQDMAMNLWRDGICGKAASGKSDVLAVKPKKGSAVLFYTLMPDGTLDKHSVHGSCPVIKGTKTVCQQWINEAFMAPHWSPELEGMWRNPSIRKGGNPDSSGNGRALAKMSENLMGSLLSYVSTEKTGSQDRICTSQGVDSRGGLLAKIGQARAFTFSTLAYIENCAEPVSFSFTAREKATKKMLGWELEIQNCRATLWPPRGSAGSAGVPPAAASVDGMPEYATSQVPQGAWFHLSLITEDLNFNETRPDLAEPWWFRTFLIVSGQGGAKSAEGKLHTGSMMWEDSNFCIAHSGAAKFSQTYFFSRQLTQFEMKRMRSQSLGDRSNNRVPP
eukprot:Tamp_14358.p1 GENE.Tamp_14358~~Tamp_14358.p1  ORF type:complete len:532 (-),score=102.92 Tamp_14358:40-1410(-)